MPFRLAGDIFKGGRDKLMNVVGVPYPEQLFIKAMTGGAAGDGTIRELPQQVLQDVRTEFDRQNLTRAEIEKEIELGEKIRQPTLQDSIYLGGLRRRLKEGDYEPEGELVETRSRPVSMYNSSRDAHLGLGTVQVHRNPDGTVRITDTWDVDGPGERTADGRIFDLQEGGRKATMVFDAANSLGTYRPMPIDIQLTADQWANAKRDNLAQAEREKTMDTYVNEDFPKSKKPAKPQFGPFPGGASPSMTELEQKKMMESFIAAMNSGEFKP